MGLIKRVNTWSYDDQLDYLSVNPTRDEVTHYKVDPHNYSDESIVKLNTVKDFGSITCLDYSESEAGLIGVGEKSGYARILNIIEDSENDYYYDFKVRAKKVRCINALVINNSGLVAVGLDRHRNDASLQIWDANYQNTDSDIINPSFSYCVNENIVSLRFLQDTSLLVSSTKFLKEIDIRSSNPVFQLPTRLSYDIKLNPFNGWQFSTYGDDGTLAIWDRRRLASHDNSAGLSLPQPLIQFDKLVGTGAASRKYMNSCFRWSTVRNWEFSTLHHGNTIKRWNLGSTMQQDENSNEYEELFVSKVQEVMTTFDRVVTFDYIPQDNYRTSLICMRQSGTVYRMPILETYSKAKFDNYNSLILSNSDSPQFDELRVSDDDDNAAFGTIQNSIKELSFEDLDIADEMIASNNINDENSDHGTETTKDGSSVIENDDTESLLDNEDDYALFWKPQKLLKQDISVIMKKRAKLEYGLDPVTTVEKIDCSKDLQNFSYIRNTWRWIAIAKAAVDDGSMASKNLDLGYEGILGIWNGLSSISVQRRYYDDSLLTEKQLNKEIEKIMKARRKNKSTQGQKNPLTKWSDSPKHIQRKLCLIISGWDLTTSDYEDKYKKIIANGNHEKAAAWAVFFGDIPKAVEILSSAKNERLQLIATAVSGYMVYKDHLGNNPWRQQCRKMASEFENPYLRVIFAFIADNDWWDVLYEPAISLRERLGVALRFLNDSDLTIFLERTSSSVISNGELEGLILTGITPSGIDLLQSYVNKTSDIQSAAMVSIFGSPRYFHDKRVDEWVSTYRDMLNSWEMFAMRAKFDVLRSKLSKTRGGTITANVRPRQLYIQCINCKKNINQPSPHINLKRNATSNSLNDGSTGNSSTNLVASNANGSQSSMVTNKRMFGTVNNAMNSNKKVKQKYNCPHCGAQLPRCAICLLPLGTSNLPFTIKGIEDQSAAGGVNKDNLTGNEDEHNTAINKKNESNTENALENKNIDNKDLINKNDTAFLDEALLMNEELKEQKRLRMNEWFSFCLSCNHGMHSGHADEWFVRHNFCPVPGCNCQCNKK
ncbi:hypothetical protein TPHA_0B01530 [Tetrapisispora phaffii CBS 4417]|uniref:Uncharacterized protein n=1 Tax=Tetrapisispora phaffii (strain ATCC 24235 / CBS 4417 / NBRC 1672 / NRRL Y-8282 / UCD 70-5) TaxID=1071381 RepID=G8BP95_TETPH|nr:hypothetical protein TPHA_0B01530 [Tetrapisispora phaffii CBS 4417]CCE61826.1 hypothetical protein TPHA_0B01530 [Tetrapisispora phaffii CBS 4417]